MDRLFQALPETAVITLRMSWFEMGACNDWVTQHWNKNKALALFQFTSVVPSGYGYTTWIGMEAKTTDSGGQYYEWDSGEPIEYTFWDAGEPGKTWSLIRPIALADLYVARVLAYTVEL